jgi:hypothetical protein
MNEIVASITKRYGAYLVSFDHHETFNDSTPVEMYDCASSLAVAKRNAKSDARGAGWTHLTWEPGPDHGYGKDALLLTGHPPDEDGRETY